jgi:hypothetical protein
LKDACFRNIVVEDCFCKQLIQVAILYIAMTQRGAGKAVHLVVLLDYVKQLMQKVKELGDLLDK